MGLEEVPTLGSCENGGFMSIHIYNYSILFHTLGIHISSEKVIGDTVSCYYVGLEGLITF